MGLFYKYAAVLNAAFIVSLWSRSRSSQGQGQVKVKVKVRDCRANLSPVRVVSMFSVYSTYINKTKTSFSISK